MAAPLALGEISKALQIISATQAIVQDAEKKKFDRFTSLRQRLKGVKEDQRESVISSFKATYEKSLKENGAGHKTTLDSLESWAFALHEFKDYRGAVELWVKATEARRRIESIPYSMDLLQVHQQLARSYKAQNRNRMATHILRANYEWCQAHPDLGEDDLHTLRVGAEYGIALHAVKEFSNAEDLSREILAKRRQAKAPLLEINMSRAQLVAAQIELGKFKSAKVLSQINVELFKTKVSHPALLKLCEKQLAQCEAGLLTQKNASSNGAGKSDAMEISRKGPEHDPAKSKRESVVNYDELLKKRSQSDVRMIESGDNSKTTPARNDGRKNPGTSSPKPDPTSKGPLSKPLMTKAPQSSPEKRNVSPAKQDAAKKKDPSLQLPAKRDDPRPNNQKPNIIDVEYRPRSLSHGEAGVPGAATQSTSSKTDKTGIQPRLDFPVSGGPAGQVAVDSPRTHSAMGNRDKLSLSARPRSASPQPSQVSAQKRFQPPLFDAQEGESDAASIYAVDGWFYDLQTQTQELLQPLRKDRCKRVRIAILDTGVDLTHPSFLNKQSKKIRRIATVEDFIEPSGNGQDTCGHGTHCLGLLRKIAPEADIYVGRVVRDSEGNLDPDVIAKAINRASRGGKDEAGVKNWDVDIITMSCGFYSWVEVVKEAIEEAYRKPTLIFAAASNNGKRKQVAFPAYMPGVVCVNSATANGTPSDFNPKFDASRSLCVLGENVTSTWITSQFQERRMSGTSVATPIAAGIAALVHEFALQTDPADESLDEILKQQLKWLKSYNGIMEIFALMAEPTGEYRTIFPWNVLSVDFDRGGVAHMIKVAMTKKFGKS